MEISIKFSKQNISYGLYDFDVDYSWISHLKGNFKNQEYYRSYQEFNGKLVQIVSILQIHHKIRTGAIPIFNDGENDEGILLTAKERVFNILAGFENGEKIKPVILYRHDNTDECINLFKLFAGCHRLHCSLIYGYKKIPAIICRKNELEIS